MPNQYHDAKGRFAKKDTATKRVTPKGFSPFDEMGRPSQTRRGETLYQDYLPQLSGRRAIRVYREMSCDPSVGAVLFAIEMLLRRMTWTVSPADESRQADEAAVFLDECRQDMSHTWADHMAAVSSMLTYGFAPFEIVYRMRTPADGSRFADGRVGWRKFGFRPQDTLDRWERDDDGGLAGMWQSLQSGAVFIPIDKMLLYQVRPGMGDPESRSVLRTAYRAWFFKKRSEEIVLVSLERSGVGMPRLRIPAESIIAGDALYERAKLMAQRLKTDETMGVVWMSDRDEHGHLLYDIDYMPVPGAPPIDGIQLIRMYAADIAASVLADFLSLGRDATGSRALADPKQELFQMALGAWADSIEEVMNRFAIPRLFKLNDFRVDRLPMLRHGPVEQIDLEQLGSFMLRMSQAGHDWGFGEDEALGGQMRQLAGLDQER